MSHWSHMPILPKFQPSFAGAESCRVCTVAAQNYDGTTTLPNLAPMDSPQYYSGALSNCDWSEDEYGLDKSVLLDQQDPANFIEIGADGTQETLQAIIGPGVGARNTQQTIFIRFRKIQTTSQHSIYGNFVSAPAKRNSKFNIMIPRNGPVLNQATFTWGTAGAAFVLPANIDYVNEYIWCFTVGPRGMECWRDGALIGRSATYPLVDTTFTGSVSGAPKVCEGFFGTKPFVPGGPNYFSGMMQFKFLYTFDRQLEEEEIMMHFNDPYGIIRPPAIWKPSKIGPLNNRVEITTPVEVVADVQSPGQEAIDTVTPSPPATAVFEIQSPSQVAVDSVELEPAEIVVEIPDQGAESVDSVELEPAEASLEVQEPAGAAVDAVEPSPVEAVIEVPEPGFSVADVVVAAVVEILAEVQEPSQVAEDSLVISPTEVVVEIPSPGASEIAQVEPEPVEASVEVQTPSEAVVDTVEPSPVEIAMEVQAISQSVIDAVVTEAVEAIFEIQSPGLDVTDGVTVEPVPVSIAMQVQAPSLVDLVTVITEAAEVVFGIARIDVNTEDDLFYLHKQSVHNSVVEAIKAGVFLPVTYDQETKLMSIAVEEEDAVPPASISANELTCLFGLPERYRRSRIFERNTWRWQVIVKFDREVVAEVFEENLLIDPILVPSDKDNGLRQITINLLDAEYIHPPRQGSSSGTQVTYTFEAQLGPV